MNKKNQSRKEHSKSLKKKIYGTVTDLTRTFLDKIVELGNGGTKSIEEGDCPTSYTIAKKLSISTSTPKKYLEMLSEEKKVEPFNLAGKTVWVDPGIFNLGRGTNSK